MNTYYSTISFNADSASNDKVPIGILSVDESQGYLIISGSKIEQIKSHYPATKTDFLNLALKSYFGSFLPNGLSALLNKPIKVAISLKDISRISVYENGILEFAPPQKVDSENSAIEILEKLFRQEIQTR